ncbi:hypothetical protein ACIQM3_16865 [Streptomyces sp. NPDC091271]|uniref:hypothetical protein n=1 Tax=Streptomyces sp. NPDC091271 TaxID=3365980 RepID=UPI00382CBF03
MAVLGSRFYVTADGGGRVESVTHPETGERVWSCSSCEAQGKGEENGRDHAATCSTTVRTTLQHHFI